jgi:SAM-dependent methyltransferase
MNRFKKLANFALAYLGFYPQQLFTNVAELGSYLRDIRLFKKHFRAKYPHWKFMYYPILTDKADQSGKARGQYFYQDLFVANLIFKASPIRHVDIGSRIDGFVAHLASFRAVDVFDIRPLPNTIQNVDFIQADLMNPIVSLEECTDSLSCLHTIEHFGLGRYGDPIDVDGHLKGLENMYRLLKPNGLFYFSTQIGPDMLAFNAHRVFSVGYLLELFKEKYEVVSFSYIDDADKLHTNAELSDAAIQRNFGCKLGCGIFVLRKK